MAVLAFFIVYFSIQALTGERGLLSSAQRQRTLASSVAELKTLRAERTELEIRTRLLSDASLSRDLLDERSREVLGLADPNDFVVRVDTSGQSR
jgi:cell division protein FtsB